MPLPGSLNTAVMPAQLGGQALVLSCHAVARPSSAFGWQCVPIAEAAPCWCPSAHGSSRHQRVAIHLTPAPARSASWMLHLSSSPLGSRDLGTHGQAVCAGAFTWQQQQCQQQRLAAAHASKSTAHQTEAVVHPPEDDGPPLLGKDPQALGALLLGPQAVHHRRGVGRGRLVVVPAVGGRGGSLGWGQIDRQSGVRTGCCPCPCRGPRPGSWPPLLHLSPPHPAAHASSALGSENPVERGK